MSADTQLDQRIEAILQRIEASEGIMSDERAANIRGALEQSAASGDLPVIEQAFAVLESVPGGIDDSGHMLIMCITRGYIDRIQLMATYYHLKPRSMSFLYFLRLIDALKELDPIDGKYLANLEAHLEADPFFPESTFFLATSYVDDTQMIQIVNRTPGRAKALHDYFETHCNRMEKQVSFSELDEYLSHRALQDGWL